jgi:putative endonuclease
MLKTDIGKNYEQAAVQYLKKSGYKIIGQNYRLKIGEIDIIAKDKKTLVFVEVKYRQSKEFGTPAEFVTIQKQNKIIKTALFYLKQNNIESDFRFDVVSICGAEIEHIKNAFSPKTSKYYF